MSYVNSRTLFPIIYLIRWILVHIECCSCCHKSEVEHVCCFNSAISELQLLIAFRKRLRVFRSGTILVWFVPSNHRLIEFQNKTIYSVLIGTGGEKGWDLLPARCFVGEWYSCCCFGCLVIGPVWPSWTFCRLLILNLITWVLSDFDCTKLISILPLDRSALIQVSRLKTTSLL